MTGESIQGRTVAFLLTDGFEQVELTEPWKAVQEAGGKPVLVSPKSDTVQGLNHIDKADTFDVDVQVKDADAADYDGLVLPGGVVNADDLRVDADSVAFAKAFFTAGKPVASICHAPWILIEAGVVDGRRMTSYPPSRPTSATRAPSGSTRRSWSTAASSRAATRTTCPRSTRS